MFFPVVMYGCENWTIKKAEHRRIDAFELSCWIRLLRVPWTARRANQSILWKISPGCWSWNSNTLATWCEELTHWKRPWCWERLRAGGEGDDRGWGGWMALPTQWMSLGKLQELVMDRVAWHAAVHGVTKSQTRLSDWPELNWRTGKPGVLQSVGSRGVGQDWVAEQPHATLLTYLHALPVCSLCLWWLPFHHLNSKHGHFFKF